MTRAFDLLPSLRRAGDPAIAHGLIGGRIADLRRHRREAAEKLDDLVDYGDEAETGIARAFVDSIDREVDALNEIDLAIAERGLDGLAHFDVRPFR